MQSCEGATAKSEAKKLEQLFEAHFGPLTLRPFIVRAAAPGRMEICGNHTDHQGGCVIAAALDQHIFGLAAPNGMREVRAFLEGFGDVNIDLDEPEVLTPHAHEVGTSAALIRGMCATYLERGGAVCGFDVVTTSDLPAGAGISSSAAFEMLVGVVLRALDAENAQDSHGLYDLQGAQNELTLDGARGSRDALTPHGSHGARGSRDALNPQDLRALALDGVRAEREYFGKACGALDQMTSAFGGVVFLDFSSHEPHVERLTCDFSRFDYEAVLINSGVDHSWYAADYDRVPADMSAVAQFLGARQLGQLTAAEYSAHRDEVVRALGESPALRADHFFAENQRVHALRTALACGDEQGFLRAVRESGASSEAKLRNIVPPRVSDSDAQAHRPQDILDACAELLQHDGAWRIHGGGFGGSVLALVPRTRSEAFVRAMDERFGPQACMRVNIAPVGARAWCETRVSASVDFECVEWVGDTRFGPLEVTINLRKPEKDPRAIARAAAEGASQVTTAEGASAFSHAAASSHAVVSSRTATLSHAVASCDLCRENAEYDPARECACDARIASPEFALDGEVWRLHFSPYRYFEKHCIVMAQPHRPMRTDRACVARLLACVSRFPFYFMGANADLPIVGGSILAHDHFQGGAHVFPLMCAPIAHAVALRAFPRVQAGIVQWPASTLRLASKDVHELAAATAQVIEAWRNFDFPEGGVLSHTCEAPSGVPRDASSAAFVTPHNTATLIAYRQSFLKNAPSVRNTAEATAEVDDTQINADITYLDDDDTYIDAGNTYIDAGHTYMDSNNTHIDAGHTYIMDIVLRNNRTTPQRPFGLFHVPEDLHYIKRENIGLIEIMGRAILPARLLHEMPGLRHDGARQREVTDAFVHILEETGVFKHNEQGKVGWRRFIRSIHDEQRAEG